MTLSPSYVTNGVLKDYLRIGDDSDSTVLDMAITAASRAVDRFCNRQFGNATQTRTFTARYQSVPNSSVQESDFWVVDLYDLSATPTSVTADGIAVTGYSLTPTNAILDGFPFTRLVTDTEITTDRGAVSVTGVWGWTSVPVAIQQATLIQASRLVMRRDAPFGIAGQPGSEMRLLARLDPDVEVSLRPYVRRWWAV